MKPDIGDTLPNRALVLAASDSHVLCLLPHAHQDRFATWAWYRYEDGSFVTVSGHYFPELTEALNDFQSRDRRCSVPLCSGEGTLTVPGLLVEIRFCDSCFRRMYPQ